MEEKGGDGQLGEELRTASCHGGEGARRCSYTGEKLPMRKCERDREKQRATLITSRRSSDGG